MPKQYLNQLYPSLLLNQLVHPLIYHLPILSTKSSGLFYVNEGYHFEYSTVQVIIENQAFTNQTNIDHLFYNLRIKPHNYPDSYWYEFFNHNRDGFPIQTSLNFTIIPTMPCGSNCCCSIPNSASGSQASRSTHRWGSDRNRRWGRSSPISATASGTCRPCSSI